METPPLQASTARPRPRAPIGCRLGSEAGLQQSDAQRPRPLVLGQGGRPGPRVPRGRPGGGAGASPAAPAGEPGGAGTGHRRGSWRRGQRGLGVGRRRRHRGKRFASGVQMSTCHHPVPLRGLGGQSLGEAENSLPMTFGHGSVRGGVPRTAPGPGASEPFLGSRVSQDRPLLQVLLASGWGQGPPQSEEPRRSGARKRPSALLVSTDPLQLLLSTHPGPGLGGLGGLGSWLWGGRAATPGARSLGDPWRSNT